MRAIVEASLVAFVTFVVLVEIVVVNFFRDLLFVVWIFVFLGMFFFFIIELHVVAVIVGLVGVVVAGSRRVGYSAGSGRCCYSPAFDRY